MEGLFLPFGNNDDAVKEREEKYYDNRGAHEAPLLAYGAKDEVGTLFGHEVKFGLRPLQKALSPQTARADGNHRLVDVVAPPERVVLYA